MNGYPLVDELEVTIRAGRGVAVIVEGQSAEEDPWFYGQWFGDRARQVTFFPQDGWTRVVEAVAELRRRCPDIPIYGIIDRDFADDRTLEADFAALGIVRTSCYTLENYLLDPACWAAVFRLIFRRQDSAPDGWDQEARVQEHIEAAYRSCLDLTAYNRVIKTVGERYRELAQTTAQGEREYLHHPNAFARIGPAARLDAWGQKMGCPEDLGARFREYRAALEAAGPADLQKLVSGKHVLHVLQSEFPLLQGAGRFGLSHYLNLYVDRCPDPPPDIAKIVDRIIRAGSRTHDREGKRMPSDPERYEIRENQVPEAQFDTSYGLGWVCEAALLGSRNRAFTVVVKSFAGGRTPGHLETVRELARNTLFSRIKTGDFEDAGYYCYRWEPEGPNAMPLTQADCEEISPGPFRSP